MRAALVCDVLVLLVASIWCKIPERPNNFGETYRVYGDTKECSVRTDGTERCRWYQTQYFQDLTTRRLRIDTNVKNFFESFYYLPNSDLFDRYIYVPSNWRQPCTHSLVSNIPIQRVPSSFTFNGTSTVEWRPCNVWRRDTGNNPVTTESWCIHDNNYVTPPTTEPLRFASQRSENGAVTLTRETLWRGYSTSVDPSYFILPAECPQPPTPAPPQPQTPSPSLPSQPQTPSSSLLARPQTPSSPTPAPPQSQTPLSPTPTFSQLKTPIFTTSALSQSQTPTSPTPTPSQSQPQTPSSQINIEVFVVNNEDAIFNNA